MRFAAALTLLGQPAHRSADDVGWPGGRRGIRVHGGEAERQDVVSCAAVQFPGGFGDCEARGNGSDEGCSHGLAGALDDTALVVACLQFGEGGAVRDGDRILRVLRAGGEIEVVAESLYQDSLWRRAVMSGRRARPGGGAARRGEGRAVKGR
jgi:hypothetical protein